MVDASERLLCPELSHDHGAFFAWLDANCADERFNAYLTTPVPGAGTPS